MPNEPQPGACNARMPGWPEKNYRNLCTLPEGHPIPQFLLDADYGESGKCDHADPEGGVYWNGTWRDPETDVSQDHTVYLLVITDGYDVYEPVGVFSSEEKAKVAQAGHGPTGPDYFIIVRFELDAILL